MLINGTLSEVLCYQVETVLKDLGVTWDFTWKSPANYWGHDTWGSGSRSRLFPSTLTMPFSFSKFSQPNSFPVLDSWGETKSISVFFKIYFIYLCTCVYMCVCILHICGCLQRPEEGFGSSKAWNTECCELPGCWEQNLYMLLSAELSLRLLILDFKSNTAKLVE